LLPSSSLAYVSFVLKQENPADFWRSVSSLQSFLPTGFAYRGDDWGALSFSVFVNQRHLISATGLLLITLLCLLEAQRQAVPEATVRDLSASDPTARVPVTSYDFGGSKTQTQIARRPLMAAGALVGLLPYWNSAVFVAALIVLGGLWLAQPQRRATATVIIAALVVGLPQILLLRSGDAMATPPPLFNPGYTIANPTLGSVLVYLAKTFGLKWIVLACAWRFGSTQERRWMAGVSVLLPAVFLLQFSVDSFNNHKLINIWNVLMAIVVGFALWRIWSTAWWRRALALALAVGLSAGAVIDLAPAINDPQLEARFKGERLTTWVLQNTAPDDVFLSQTWLHHSILFSGRRLFLGYTLYAWSAGYKLGNREEAYKKMLTERNPTTLRALLRKNDVQYVVFDDGLRNNPLLRTSGHNEEVFRANFGMVFEDTERRHDNLVIFQVQGR
jgi:hypothetical protein